MGRRGPKPKPSALDKLDGGASHRKRNRLEPKPPASEAACPSVLRGDRRARAIWETEAPRMIRLGLLTTADRLMFAALCERAAVYWRAAAKLRRSLTRVSRGGVVRMPEVDIAQGALAGLKQIAAAFGMTPADRKGLEVDLGAGAARGGGSDPATAAKRGPGEAVEIDDFLRRRDARRVTAERPG